MKQTYKNITAKTRHLFLAGSSGIGKSTLLLGQLEAYVDITGGFFTQRLLDPAHSIHAFRLVPFQRGLLCTGSYLPDLPDIFLVHSPSGQKRDLSVFETTGKLCLESAHHNPLCYLDEIGGIELLLPSFRNALYNLLDDGPPCIGVIKSRQNLSSMLTRIRLSPYEQQLLFQFHEDITQRFQGEILAVEEFGQRQLEEQISRFLSDAVPGFIPKPKERREICNIADQKA